MDAEVWTQNASGAKEIVQLIEDVNNSQFSTEQLIKLAELCDFCFEYGCANVNEFLQQQFLFGCDIRSDVVICMA